MTPIDSKTRLDGDEFLRKLNSLDFGPLVYKLMHEEDRPGLSIEQAVDAVQRYKGFLFLYYMNPGKTLSPSRYIDHVWHTHILDTELYLTQTAFLFGHYLHHFPFFGMRSDEDKKGLMGAADLTTSLAAKSLGWDDDDWCGTGRHPKWPKPHRSYVADLCAVLFPAGGLAKQLSESKETITIEAGSFRQTIEHVGSPDADLLNVSEPPPGYPEAMDKRAAELARRPDRLAIAERAIKLPIRITVCKPVSDMSGAFVTNRSAAELLETSKGLSKQRLQPEGFANDLVQLQINVGAVG